jgi:hypothetical protein
MNVWYFVDVVTITLVEKYGTYTIVYGTNTVLYTMPYYGDQDYDGIRPVFVPYLILNGRIRRSYD